MRKLLTGAGAALLAWLGASAKALAVTVTVLTNPLSTTSSGPNFSIGTTSACPAGSTSIIIQSLETNSLAAKPVLPSDGTANQYLVATTSQVFSSTPQFQLGVWYSPNIPNAIAFPSNVTFNYGGATTVAHYALILCVSGLDQFRPLDLDSGGGTPFTGTTNLPTVTAPKQPGPPATLTYPNEMVLAMIWVQGGGTTSDTWTPDPDSSWVPLANTIISNVRGQLHVAYKLTSSTAAVTWNPTNSVSTHTYIGSYDTFVISGQALTPHGHVLLMSGGNL